VLWIRDTGWIKNHDPDPGSGSGMNILDQISKSLETIWVKILKFFGADADPGSGNLFDPGSGIRDGKNTDPGSGINIPDPQHCWLEYHAH
jgi:hypothetical protein